MSATREQILAATRQWLKPLAHVLLRSGITWKDFSELTRLVFVEVAQARFGHRGSKPATVSRIAVLTGLARRDVRKLQDGLAAGPGAPTGFTTKGSLILSHWHQDGDFRAADGSPSLITVDGDGPTFSELLRRAGASDVRPGSILKEMIAANAVESLPDGRLRALSRNFVPQSMSPTSVRLWGSVIADLAETRSHNLLRTADVAARFERAAINDRIDPAALPEFRAMLAREGQEFLERVDAWLTAHELPPDDDSPRIPIRLGVGTYHVEDPTNHLLPDQECR